MHPGGNIGGGANTGMVGKGVPEVMGGDVYQQGAVVGGVTAGTVGDVQQKGVVVGGNTPPLASQIMEVGGKAKPMKATTLASIPTVTRVCVTGGGGVVETPRPSVAHPPPSCLHLNKGGDFLCTPVGILGEVQIQGWWGRVSQRLWVGMCTSRAR